MFTHKKCPELQISWYFYPIKYLRCLKDFLKQDRQMNLLQLDINQMKLGIFTSKIIILFKTRLVSTKYRITLSKVLHAP